MSSSLGIDRGKTVLAWAMDTAVGSPGGCPFNGNCCVCVLDGECGGLRPSATGSDPIISALSEYCEAEAEDGEVEERCSTEGHCDERHSVSEDSECDVTVSKPEAVSGVWEGDDVGGCDSEE